MPLTGEGLEVVCRNVMQAQDLLGRILIENPATYLQFRHSTIPESEFLAALVARTGCGLICDLNNIVVSTTNHGWDPEAYLDSLPASAIGEDHLAGYSAACGDAAGLLLDTHDRAAPPEVWSLFETAIERIGPHPTLIEWDRAIPPLPVLVAEAAEADCRLSAWVCNPGDAVSA